MCVLSHMFIAKNRSQSAQHNRFNSLHISSAARYKLGSILLTPRPKKKHPYVAAKLRARRCACPARCISILIILSETNKWQETPNIDKTSTLDGGRKVWRFGVRTFAASVRTHCTLAEKRLREGTAHPRLCSDMFRKCQHVRAICTK